MHRYYIYISFVIVILYAFPVSAEPSILVNGNISEIINKIRNISNNQQVEYPGDNNAISVDIFGTTGNWEVELRLDENAWHNDLRIFARRTSAGKGSNSIAGGDNYRELTNTYQKFFSGNGDRSGINIQVMLAGVSIHVPPEDYSCNIEFRIVPGDVVHDIDRDIVFPSEKDFIYSTKNNAHKIINDKDNVQDKKGIDDIRKSKTIPAPRKDTKN